MPRRSRRCEESQYLHIIVQGIEKRYIFEKKSYKNKFYELMINKAEKFNVKILSYCIMDNHAHILVCIDSIINLGNYMKSVNTGFAKFYNENEQRVGYVFRDRYLSESIMSEKQLYNCISYIHFNPVKANMVRTPENYYYSSYNDYINKQNIVDDEVLKFVFGSASNYIELFKFIHYGFEDCMETTEKSNVDYSNLKIKDVKDKTKEELALECLRLKSYNISNRKIAELLKIDRNKVDRILKVRQRVRPRASERSKLNEMDQGTKGCN